MYKVFIFDRLIILTTDSVVFSKYAAAKIVEASSRRTMKEAYNDFINNQSYLTLILYNNQNLERLLDEFISLFWYVEAAGGMVYNSQGERLFIFRFGKWDLPKGKIEKYETHSEAAVREVQEETGLQEVEITEEIPSTFHIFDHKGKKVLKRTYWFKMIFTGNTTPKPQLEEEITEAVWIPQSNIQMVYNNTYASLRTILEV